MCIQYKHSLRIVMYSIEHIRLSVATGKVLYILIKNIMGKWLNNKVKSVTTSQTWTDMSTTGVQKGPVNIFHALNALKL